MQPRRSRIPTMMLVGPGPLDNVAQISRLAEQFQPVGQELLPRLIGNVAHRAHAQLRMFVQAVRDLKDQAAVAQEHNAGFAQGPQHNRAVENAPAHHRHQAEAAAQHHEPSRQYQSRIDVAHQGLRQKSDAYRLQGLLDEQDSLPDADLGVEIVKVQSQQDGAQHDEEAPEAPVIEQVDHRVYFEEQEAGRDEAAKNEDHFRDQQRENIGRDDMTEQSDHLSRSRDRAPALTGKFITRAADCASRPPPALRQR